MWITLNDTVVGFCSSRLVIFVGFAFPGNTFPESFVLVESWLRPPPMALSGTWQSTRSKWENSASSTVGHTVLTTVYFEHAQSFLRSLQSTHSLSLSVVSCLVDGALLLVIRVLLRDVSQTTEIMSLPLYKPFWWLKSISAGFLRDRGCNGAEQTDNEQWWN